MFTRLEQQTHARHGAFRLAEFRDIDGAHCEPGSLEQRPRFRILRREHHRIADAQRVGGLWLACGNIEDAQAAQRVRIHPPAIREHHADAQTAAGALQMQAAAHLHWRDPITERLNQARQLLDPRGVRAAGKAGIERAARAHHIAAVERGRCLHAAQFAVRRDRFREALRFAEAGGRTHHLALPEGKFALAQARAYFPRDRGQHPTSMRRRSALLPT